MFKAIGFEENSFAERSWQQMFALAEKYFKDNGNLNINTGYETENGEKLGVWISSQRSAYGKGRLSKERIEALEKIGVSWHRDKSRWNTAYDHVAEYFYENGNIDVLISYENSDGFKLGTWIRNQRKKHADEKLNICWTPNDSA